MYNDSAINRIIEESLREDLGMGDITTDSIILEDQQGEAKILVKENGVIAGLEVAASVFFFIDPELDISFSCSEGDIVVVGTVAAIIKGKLSTILQAERTALNILQRLSGIATMTRRFVKAVEGTKAKITDTRKTAPGLRFLDKMAVHLGGGVNHRFGLDDMVLIKDNHIAAAGGIGNAIERCLAELQKKEIHIKIEVEAKNIEEVQTVMNYSGVHRIMLDNFSIDDMRTAVGIINRKMEVEASGGITLDTVRTVAETGVDFISVGALTHSPKALDISLDVSLEAKK